MKTSSSSEIVHKTGFKVAKFRVWNTKPNNTTVSHYCYSGITKFPRYWPLFTYYHLIKKWFCFKGEIQSFRRVKREQPCICFQALVLQILSTPTIVSQWHVLCAVFLMNTAYTSPTPPTQPLCHKCNAFKEGFLPQNITNLNHLWSKFCKRQEFQ